MSRKGILTYNVFHFLKERKNILQENLLPAHPATPEEYLECIEFLFWGFVPSHGTRQDDSFLIMEEEVASSTPGPYGYNPVSGKFFLLGSMKPDVGGTSRKEVREHNVKPKTNDI
jgi:hypothetical protein